MNKSGLPCPVAGCVDQGVFQVGSYQVGTLTEGLYEAGLRALGLYNGYIRLIWGKLSA